NGAVRGSVRIAEFTQVVVPGIAAAFNNQILSNGPQKALILQMFDLGGCFGPPNNMQAQPMDGKIDECEVSTSMLFQVLLAPDVQIYDGNGMYKPNPDPNAKPDSFSVGIGFTGVRGMW